MAVYVGIQNMEYAAPAAMFSKAMGPYNATGSALSVASGRVSFTLNFKGPALSVDTACSSALTATHLGFQYTRLRPQNAAVASAVNLLISNYSTAVAQAAGMLTLDGRCKTLDQSADGYVRCAEIQYF